MNSSTGLVQQVSSAMSAASIEHQVVTSNIANRDAQDYQRLKVRFDAAMSGERSVHIVADESAGEVSLEQDLLALSMNSGRYQALARSLNRYFAIVSAIASYNRG